MATSIPRRRRPHCRRAAWSCPRQDLVRCTRLLLLLRPQWCPAPGIRRQAQAFSVDGPSSTAGPRAALAVAPEAIRSARPADLREQLGNSLAGLVQSTPHALHPAAMPAPVDRADLVDREHGPALALAPDLAGRRVQDSVRVPEQVVHLRRVRLHVRSARPINAPVAALRSIRRRRKAQ